MKGLSVKKLAAVALGGALIGSALAPVVSAAVTSNVDTLQKSDVVSATTGDPVVNVAVGSMGAAPSDYVWAGNIAAKVAQLATVDKSVTITGGDGGTPDLTGVTVDVTVGGDVSYATESSKTYEGSSYPLQSDPNSARELVKELSSAQLPFLTNETRTYRYAGTSYSIVAKETIGINIDAKMDLVDKDVEDLVAYMTGEGDFNYVLNLGDGIPLFESLTAAAAFADGDNDNIIIPFLGEEFTVQSVDNNSNTVKLIKESDKSTYYEGDEFVGLEGKGNYDGEELSVKVDAVTQSGAATTTYNVRYLLLDAEGNEIDRQTLGTGVYLNDNFVDSEGDYALETVAYISDVGVESTTSKGYVTATVGKSVIDLKNNEQFPYDSTDTTSSNDYWKALLTMTGSDTNPATATLTHLTVKNAVTKWNSVSPLWPATGSLTQSAPEGEAIFLDGNDEGGLGYGFVKIKFDGLKVDQSTTTFKLGKGACETAEGQEAGCLIYTDNAGVEREVPFYVKLELTTGPSDEGTFYIDDQTFYYRCDTTDTNMDFVDGDYLNGATLDTNYGPAGEFAIVTDWNTDGFDINGNASCEGMGGTCSNDINGLFVDLNMSPASVLSFAVGVDGNCQFAKESFNNYTPADGTILTANGQTPKYETMFYDDDNTNIDKAWGFPTMDVTNDSLNDTYQYRMYVTDETSYKDVYLFLDGSTDFTNEFSTADVDFNGTDYTSANVYIDGAAGGPYWGHNTTAETGYRATADANFYVPDHTALGFDPTDTTYFVATFGFDTNNSGTDVYAYVGTEDNELITLPNSDMTGYVSQVDINRLSGWSLRSDSPDNQSTATWLDYGSKVEVISTDSSGEYAKVTVPESQIYLQFAVLGEGTVTTAAGGTAFTGLAEGEAGEEGSTKVTVDAIAGGVCPAAGGAVADPAVAQEIVPVGQLVFLDTPEPAGAHIIVGGWLVNKLVSSSTSLGEGEGTLGEALTSSDDRVVQLLGNGDIIVAGYTAAGTKEAANDLIDALDALS